MTVRFLAPVIGLVRLGMWKEPKDICVRMDLSLLEGNKNCGAGSYLKGLGQRQKESWGKKFSPEDGALGRESRDRSTC